VNPRKLQKPMKISKATKVKKSKAEAEADEEEVPNLKPELLFASLKLFMKNQKNKKSLTILTSNQEATPEEDKNRKLKRHRKKRELSIQLVKMMIRVCLDRKISKVQIMRMSMTRLVRLFNSISLRTIFLAETVRRKSSITT